MVAKKDFFVSFNSADKDWAVWIAWRLEKAEYSVIVQSWDFRPGQNFVIGMQDAASAAQRTIAVLSPDFLAAKFTRPEWAAAFAQDPTGTNGILVPVRVRECEVTGLLPQIVYIDLVGKTEEEAASALITGVSRQRNKPSTAPAFPAVHRKNAPLSVFPGTQLTTQGLHKRTTIQGIWIARFTYVDGQEYQEQIDLQYISTDELVGRIAPSLDNCLHTAAVDHLRPVRLRGTVSGDRFITGVWFQSAHPEQHGAFQLQISSESERLVGGWLKFSESKSAIVTGSWEWLRALPRRDLVVGVYGVTGAGKTTLCQEIVRLAPECRFFSESKVIEKFLIDIEGSNFAEVSALSERGRMAVREKAFSLHSERIKNSHGVIFGDAHYSFPSQRLGKIDHDHPDAEYGIQPVIPEAAWSMYQAIAYLDTSPRLVWERLHRQSISTPKNYWARNLTETEIQHWSLYEKRKLAHQCAMRHVAFFEVVGDRQVEDIAEDVLRLASEVSAQSR